MNGGIQLVRDMMELRETPFLQFLKRLIPERKDQLVCVYIPLMERFTVGIWANRLQGRIVELFSYCDEDEITQEDVLSLKFNLHDESRLNALRDWTERQFALNKQHAEWWSEAHETRKDYRKYITSKIPNHSLRNDPRWLCCI